MAAMLGLSLVRVRNKANRLGLCLNKQAAHRIVHSRARAYMLAHNPMKRPEVREKVRRWATDTEEGRKHHEQLQVSAGRRLLQHDNPTAPERQLFSILDGLGVPYTSHAIIKPKFIVDALVGRVVIQVDGEYWHGHGRFYPLTERQQKQRQRDAAQDSYLRACGYTVVRIWAADLCEETVTRALDGQAKHSA